MREITLSIDADKDKEASEAQVLDDLTHKFAHPVEVGILGLGTIERVVVNVVGIKRAENPELLVRQWSISSFPQLHTNGILV